MIKLNAQQLRTTKKDSEEFKRLRKNPIYIVLDNILDTYNIGSIFRLADAVAAEEVIITGQAEVPPNTRIKKASINTTEWVKWHYESTAKEAIIKIKNQISNIKVIAIEQDKKSVSYTEMKWEFPVAVVVGNETYGVSREVLKMCDAIVELPMFGVNISLNVMVSLGIVLYKIVEKC
ncbi:RNA methyltransferase [Candidatus Shapirobacteria bacterium CG03_land_8_20_14_0_80_40_19]|uniref:RNA methyltransferase n=4 Tax=Patescibacteria group TaxID=1783273 RepID=A0A2M7BEG0_9BACT|nr:MAG: RNA methyltransferase [Candidatus Shapirobacteria bacterium CG11_big_fil_rev_8_21_14_0_20_40_12]PIV01474.1 MAG: RNA methyltransferase [Candidatus Shapirobacteria bacterium CG03_land_8_20_14_0_80_40_19]PIZ56791.1 MAG: RNA methyltransferase [Candidatus Tagabacteria bacterium CG_4_10_14_0_2_um_filter_40_13]PJC29058.1 MAG: RNA methyltransferase [Candidatus Shapirobacteria bacterium CG_4_9_14_0_2_um_filter_40_11]PJC69959.1 MAG: RNA methyltransferase [Candidatus Tagabacteria bacterium CG_4_8_